MNEAEFTRRLAARALQIGLRIDEPEQRGMFLHFQLLRRWNRKINLTGITDPDQIITKHFIDSLTLADLPEAGFRVLDLGSGAGFPGLPLALMRADLSLVLAEAGARKRAFLDQVVRILGLSRVRIVGRSTEIEDDPDLAHGFDLVVTRALGGFPRILTRAAPFLREGGRILAMKGPRVFKELVEHAAYIEEAGFSARVVIEVRLPDSGEKRLVVSLAAE